MLSQTYRLSRYTLLAEAAESLLSIYNTCTGKHAVVDLRRAPAFKIVLDTPLFTAADCGQEVFDALRIPGFIVAADTDELEQLRRRRAEALRHDYGVRLAVMPTLACNFSCPYCFQGTGATAQVMSEETEDNLIRFTRRTLTTDAKGPLVVMWFGGEPLLELNRVLRLSGKLRALADEMAIEFHSSLVTNGYLLQTLTPEIVSELGLSFIQVTIDGPREVHDRRRPLKDNRGTFDVILENIAALSRFFPSITIRINVDRSNYRQVPSLLSELRERGVLDRCVYRIAPVNSVTGACAANACTTFDPREWAEIDQLIYKAARSLDIAHRAQERYPAPWPLACSAQVRNAWLVDPEGNLYKCLNDPPLRERAVCNINREQELNPLRASHLAASTPFGRKCCEHCRFMPLCNAGCPAANVDGKTHGFSCTSLKYSLKDRLVHYAKDYADCSEDRLPHQLRSMP